jgi:hypothetical protein
MTNHRYKKHSQRGSVLVLVTISMVVLLGVTGLALDMGHAYLLKTRLQNALDAAALSGAKTLDITHDTAQAETDARNTFDINAGDDLNETGLVPTVEFSDILFDPAQALDPKYIRVGLVDYQQPMWFAHILPGVGNNKLVSATAVAGPTPVLAEICDILPVMVCGDPAGDTDCTDGACYGYSFDPNSTTETVLKAGSSDDFDVGAGNYQLIRLGDSKGGSDIRENLAGSYENCLNTSDGDIETEPGNTVGPVAQGLNTRFGQYNGPFQPDDRAIYKPDLVTTSVLAPDAYYGEYASIYTSGGPFDNLDGDAHRRIVAVPIGDCSTTTNGQGTVDLLEVACFFLTRPAEQNGDQRIYGQFVTGCKAHGTPGPSPDTGPGPYTIQLYKDPDSGDA